MGTPKHLITLIKNLYDNNAAYVRMEDEMSNTFNISKGVRQGCTQSYVSTSMVDNEKGIGWDEGTIMSNSKINNLKYAKYIMLPNCGIRERVTFFVKR